MTRRTLTVGIALVGFALGAPSSVSASSSAGSGTECAEQAVSRPFLPWLDLAPYTMPTGGSFEDDGRGWSLKKGAEIATGNEPYAVHSESDTMSLRLPPGSSAVSSPICIGLGHPTMRFFAKKSGGLLGNKRSLARKRLLLSTLRVDVRYEDLSGAMQSLPVGTVTSGGSWQPTLPIPVVVNLLTLLPNVQTDVAFAFTPTGNAGWRIDDVYVDPYRRG